MLRFLIFRILSAIPTLLLLSVVTFIIIQAPPGDYGDYIRSQLINQAGASAAEAEAQANAYREANGLNDPLVIQYFRWLWGILTQFDFGQSLYFNKPVSDVVASRLPATIAIALASHIIATLLGASLGIIAATRQYSWIDSVLGIVAFLGMTIPRFLLALVIIYILVFQLNVTEVGSFYSPEFGGQPMSFAKFVNLLWHIWPVIAIAVFGGLAYQVRVMRGNLLDVLNAQYVETARAKGLPERTVILKHAVPNALHPLVAYQGVALPYMLTGEIEVAIIFGIATVGPAIVESMNQGDVFLTSTFMLVLAATLIVGNILADLLLYAIDPRTRLAGER
ncbi:MAG: ABC transporter permease [Rhizobiaceae bacterium]|nr:ABC transporter permease [Rhizobiaceae bacterium]